MRRPILFPGFFYCAGIVLAFQIVYEKVPAAQIIAAVLGCALSFVLIVRFFDFKTKELLIFLLCLVLGFGNLALRVLMPAEDLSQLAKENHSFTLKVDDAISKDAEKLKLDCTLLKVDEEELLSEPKIRVTIYDKKAKLKDYYGATIETQGKIAVPKSNTNPYCFNYKTYLKTVGIDYILSGNKCKIISTEDSLKRSLLTSKEEYLQMLGDAFDNNDAVDMIRGMVFGDKSNLDEDLYDSFRRNGTAHILAVSGLHVGLIFMGLRRLLKKGHRRLYYVSTALVLIAYGTITQWSVSVVRAVIMIGVVLAGEIIHRRYDMLSGVVTAGIILLTANPFQLFSCGFQMSFLAVIGIAFFNKRLAQRMPGYFAMITSVQLTLLPYMAFQFNYISVSAFIINYPTTLLVGFIVPGILVLFLLFSLFGFQLIWVHQVFIWITELLIKCNTFTDSLGFGSFDVTSPSLFFIMIFIMAALFGFSEFARIDWLRKNYKRIGICVLVLTLISYVFSYDVDKKFDDDNIVFVDVGQGDCVNLKTDEENYIFDSGGVTDYNLGEKTLKPYLLKNGQSGLDGSFITHNHTDHFKGACELSQTYPIKTMYFSKNYQVIKEELENSAKADEYKYLDNSQKVILDQETQVQILWPKAGDADIDVEDENKNSMVMKIIKNGVSVLITGDIDSNCEKNLVEFYKGTDALSADILKVPHHGSKNSSSEEFLKAVSPKVAVIQVGKNTYGHPTQEALDRLNASGAKVYRLDEAGAVGVEILEDGKFNIDCMLY